MYVCVCVCVGLSFDSDTEFIYINSASLSKEGLTQQKFIIAINCL